MDSLHASFTDACVYKTFFYVPLTMLRPILEIFHTGRPVLIQVMQLTKVELHI